jgi:hypothetical protein
MTPRNRGPGAPSKLSPQEWAEIRAAYAVGRSLPDLAREYGITRQRLNERANKENWTRDATKEVAIVTANRLAGIADSLAPDLRQQAISEEAQRRVEILHRHRHEWSEHIRREQPILERLEKATDPLVEDGDRAQARKEARELAAINKILAETLAIRQVNERRAWSVDVPVDPHEGTDAEKRTQTIREVLDLMDALEVRGRLAVPDKTGA